MTLAILSTIITIAYALFLHYRKDQLNNWLDMYAPVWYTKCSFCRGVEFGVLLGILISLSVLMCV